MRHNARSDSPTDVWGPGEGGLAAGAVGVRGPVRGGREGLVVAKAPALEILVHF